MEAIKPDVFAVWMSLDVIAKQASGMLLLPVGACRKALMVIVYTAILGGCDSLKPAPKGADVCLCFSDNPDHLAGPNGWTVKKWTAEDWWELDPRREAWRLRSVPHQLFDGTFDPEHLVNKPFVIPGGYSTSVWVDASFALSNLPKLLLDSSGHDLSALKHHKRSTCYAEAEEVVKVGQAEPFEVATQMAGYRCEGFNPSALSISCIIVRRNTPKVTAFNELWDAEIKKNPGDNTQLSIDYCAWKTGVGVHHLQGVRKDNPYAVHDHEDHKKRRKPYR